jgi:hypothetical protein
MHVSHGLACHAKISSENVKTLYHQLINGYARYRQYKAGYLRYHQVFPYSQAKYTRKGLNSVNAISWYCIILSSPITEQ